MYLIKPEFSEVARCQQMVTKFLPMNIKTKKMCLGAIFICFFLCLLMGPQKSLLSISSTSLSHRQLKLAVTGIEQHLPIFTPVVDEGDQRSPISALDPDTRKRLFKRLLTLTSDHVCLLLLIPSHSLPHFCLLLYLASLRFLLSREPLHLS